jgi:hypothetical protein
LSNSLYDKTVTNKVKNKVQEIEAP